MTIQIPNPGTGNGQTGDNEFVLWSKVKDNFNDQNNAASRLVGESDGDVPEMTDKGINGLGYGATTAPNVGGDLNTHSNKSWLFRGSDLLNAPTTGWCYYDTQVHGTGYAIQFAHHLTDTYSYVRRQAGGDWGKWYPMNTSKSAYDNTTASGANVVIGNDGQLKRSTSSERYKNILADLELDDTAYDNAMQLAPIIYRSTAAADNPDYHFYSFSAEALGVYDPAFTLWRDTETVTDSQGNITEQPLAKRQAEGINLNAIVAFLHATNVKQDKLIKSLSERIDVLESK